MKVLVIQRRLTHYRLPFFNALRQEMASKGLELILAYGKPSLIEQKKNDSGEIDWGIPLSTSYFFGDKICWQPFLKLANDADVIVIAHENKLIFNLFVQWFFKRKKVVLWGHGQNLQRNNPDIRDQFKKITACKADWWLGYTKYSLPLIKNNEYPEERITILNNSIDTNELSDQILSINDNDIKNIRNKFNIKGGNIGIYIGSLYQEKRIKFLIDAVIQIKSRIPNFEIIIAGNGSDLSLVEEYSAQYDWLHYVGTVKGQDKAVLLSISKVMLNPGLVGLGILDAFVSKTPIVTTDCKLHSPEISYLNNGLNGIMTADSLDDYVSAVCDLLEDNNLYTKLVNGCEASAKLYTVENMAKNFTDGIEKCISSKAYRY